MVGAGINPATTPSVKPALSRPAPTCCASISEGYSDWQKMTIEWVREHYGNDVKIGAATWLTPRASCFLADAGADFVKIGIGGGSICITMRPGYRPRPGHHIIEWRRPATVFPRDRRLGPICLTAASCTIITFTSLLSCWAATSARFDESPSAKVMVNGTYMKEYWGEGSARARNWGRYDLGGKKSQSF